jgi:hypothetical protein
VLLLCRDDEPFIDGTFSEDLVYRVGHRASVACCYIHFASKFLVLLTKTLLPTLSERMMKGH